MAIEHVVVLCLENRSFDHMLGFLEHPDPTFDGLLRGGPFGNLGSTGIPTAATPDARVFLPYGPDHSHNAVVAQLAIDAANGDLPTNKGFVTSYELKAAGRSPGHEGGLVGWFKRHLPLRRGDVSDNAVKQGSLLMRCQDPANVPVLSTLATEFAVCDNWFCSVPGETWPNRNYLHAATSDGETTIKLRPYRNRTIFELLEEESDHDWRIYHADVPQILAFPNLWDTRERHAKWFPLSKFGDHIKAGDLPAYTFIEPDHTPPPDKLDVLQARHQSSGRGNSQHPDNNLVSDTAYDTFEPRIETDFERGERLIATIYEHLRANPSLFATTVFLITYDEHGGFYDHAVPPQRVEDPGRLRPRHLDRILYAIVHEDAQAFDFSRVGIRVPTVIVSPLIRRGTAVHTFFEHASVPATVRALFAPDADPLNQRDGGANTFHSVWTSTGPRTDLPDLSSHLASSTAPSHVRAAGSTWTPAYYQEFLGQAEVARKHLNDLGEYETAGSQKASTRTGGAAFTDAFTAAAQRHRAELTP